jgi:hypothetical protein
MPIQVPPESFTTTLGAALSAFSCLKTSRDYDTTIPLLERKVNVQDHRTALLEQSAAIGASHIIRYLLQAEIDVASYISSCPNLLVAARHTFADIGLRGPAALELAMKNK